MYKLTGKLAVVTGGAMGIGLATSKRLLKDGAIVVILDINESVLNSAIAELSPIGKVFGFICDVTDKSKVKELSKKISKEIGTVSILVNNAGTVVGGDFLDRPMEDWERTIAINLSALLYTTYAFLPAMYANDEGRIVNISSAAGLLGVPNLAVYSATKWAVYGLTESMRFEAKNRKKNGVKFSSIHPSYIAKGLFQGAKLGFLGNLIAPLLKDHDVIAKAIVESAIKRGRHSPKRPLTVGLVPRLRGILPDCWFQKLVVLLGIPDSMNGWEGRKS